MAQLIAFVLLAVVYGLASHTVLVSIPFAIAAGLLRISRKIVLVGVLLTIVLRAVETQITWEKLARESWYYVAFSSGVLLIVASYGIGLLVSRFLRSKRVS